jgi:hypothetical protein
VISCRPESRREAVGADQIAQTVATANGARIAIRMFATALEVAPAPQ